MNADSVSTARAFWSNGDGSGEIREAVLAPPNHDEVLVETRFGAISRGTETLVYRGDVPPSEHERMRAPFQEGAFPGPVKYGYCAVGRVRQGPQDLLGRDVFCLYPHQTRFVVPADAVTPLPSQVPAARAVLAANLETAVNAIWDSGATIGDRIAVVGGGVIGMLVGWLASAIPGTNVEVIDVDRDRESVARAIGTRFATPDTASRDVDVVFHASATEAGLATALTLAGLEATVVELSWFGANRPRVPLGESFHARRLTLRASQVGTLPPHRRSRWSHGRRLTLVMELLTDAALDHLVTGSSTFETLPDVLSRCARGDYKPLCHRIHYSQESECID